MMVRAPPSVVPSLLRLIVSSHYWHWQWSESDPLALQSLAVQSLALAGRSETDPGPRRALLGSGAGSVTAVAAPGSGSVSGPQAQ